MNTQQSDIQQIMPLLPLFLEEAKDAKEQGILQRKKLTQQTIAFWAAGLLANYGLTFLFVYASGLVYIFLIFWSMQAFSRSQKQQIAYQTNFQQTVFKFILQNLRPNWVLENQPSLTLSLLKKASIFNEHIKITPADFCIKGLQDGLPVELYDVHVAIKDKNTATDGVYDGWFIVWTLPETCNYKTVVAPYGNYQNAQTAAFIKLDLHQKGYQQYKETDLTFNKYFKLYTAQGSSLPNELSLVQQRQLAHFVLNHKKQVSLSFQKNKCYIAIKTDGINRPTLKGNTPPEVYAKDFYTELVLALDLLQRLSQNTPLNG